MHLALKVASVEERGVCDQNSGRECAPHRYTVSPATPLRQAAAASGLRGGEALRLKPPQTRSEEHTSELQSLMRTSYAVFCLKKKKRQQHTKINRHDLST